MPELPEIETLRQDLSRFMVGKSISAVSAANNRSIRAHSTVGEFEEPLIGTHVREIRRKGKFLSITVSSRHRQDFALVAHMGMSGQLRRFASRIEIPKHSHVVLELSDESLVVFVDPRTFGQLYLDELNDSGLASSLSRLGIDPINQPEQIFNALQKCMNRKIGIKWLLLDQSHVCGIGNMYADEILFRAGIRFDRPCQTLSAEEVAAVASAISEVLNEAIQLRGSSLKDLQYRDVAGGLGGYQNMHLAYGREGLECQRCHGIVERMFSKGRSSYLCRSCQR
ncbi:MAG: bifunctional DNA-formamidopyrimidine glycosylase/DNA-(apurinic or apyrimidinic site) lyase [Actinomycetota bacterium]|nr:MAG: bifunctional DNA-formamidopyrimidine glycosylase/DNA-(apurinic or apyrimidinic site) lyase [Actinomycetota bacterium]